MAQKHATIVTDLGFGDAGKGSMVDYFARQGGVSAVVRFNGGGQAAHNVVTPDGRHHTFSQFGSGTFVPGVRTHLSRFMLVDPLSLMAEADELLNLGCGDVLSRLTIDADALVVTPFHKAANLIREYARGGGAHGTCGAGIGETMALSLLSPELTVRVSDLRDGRRLFKKLWDIQAYYMLLFLAPAYLDAGIKFANESQHPWTDADMPARWAVLLEEVGHKLTIVDGTNLGQLAREGNLIFEGAQGVLLDEWHGFHPHTTWSTTTSKNAETLLREIEYKGTVERVGVLRAYHTRHGTGPFPTEDASLTELLPDMHNSDKGHQGKFRAGWFDAVLARYAIAVSGGVDTLALTHLDRIAAVKSDIKIATAYDAKQDIVTHNLLVKPVLEDLGYQEAMTRFVSSITPVYEVVKEGTPPEHYVMRVEELLSVPVHFCSKGPTTLDKYTR